MAVGSQLCSRPCDWFPAAHVLCTLDLIELVGVKESAFAFWGLKFAWARFWQETNFQDTKA